MTGKTNEEIIKEYGKPENWISLSDLLDLARTDEREKLLELPRNEHFRAWHSKYFKVLSKPCVWVSNANGKKYSTKELVAMFEKSMGESI